ncbi:hypothetical protein G6L37_34815 [Agrobacterium rubi]|nr:hypothetical protein [Agrobacterium rubi]NTF23741.1 hypothetical protein [Agrobacterium rubi]
MVKQHDIKAPDGFLLGGVRRVRKDGTILFQRGYWAIPEADRERFIGEDVWCHIFDKNGPGERHKGEALEVAEPGYHIFDAKSLRMTVLAERTEKADAKPALRNPAIRDYVQRVIDGAICEACGKETHPHEAACIHCGEMKTWAKEADSHEQ